MTNLRGGVPESIRRTAINVAVLFIVATVVFSIGQAAHGPILGDPNYLDLASASAGRIVAGTLVELIGVLAIPLTAVFLFPLLRCYSEPLAMAYVTIRTIEAIPLIVVEATTFAILTVSQSSLGADGSIDWQTAGATLQTFRAGTFLMSVGLVFPIGCMLLNAMLLRTGLVPSWIAIWGLAAGAILLTGSALIQFGVFAEVPPTMLEVAAAGPVALQEMVFAVWLLVKGFDPEATRRLTPDTAGLRPR